MFYFLNESEASELRSALATLQRLYRHSFVGDMLIALDRNAGFAEDARFVAALQAQRPSAQEASLMWRLHVLVWCAQNALRLEGDFVECGVHRGFMTAVAAHYLDFGTRAKTWHLFDTFSGIPADQLDPGHSNPAAFQVPGLYEAVAQRFAAYPNVVVHRGRVPEVLRESAPPRVAFLHLDMNSSKAEVGALEVLYERLVPGAFVLLDDYGWCAYRQQKIAEDAFFEPRGCKILELPTGQGLVLKGAD
jgi:O-methyltransferase